MRKPPRARVPGSHIMTWRGDALEKSFRLKSPFAPSGDQPEAIRGLIEGLSRGVSRQVLLGVTGSGKTFTMANVIAGTDRPALIIAPNKTLAAPLIPELKDLLPQHTPALLRP